MPCLILKTSRFFWEKDDNPEIRNLYNDVNVKANEYTHRRVDVSDIVEAHLLAVDRVEAIGFSKYIISATSPFTKEDLSILNVDASSILNRYYPKIEAIYNRKSWKLFSKIGRVYINQKARTELNWQPKYNFQYVLDCLEKGIDFRSPLAIEIGVKGYHGDLYKDGLYPIVES